MTVHGRSGGWGWGRATHGRRLEINRSFGVENEMKQAAVGVIALELDIEGCREVEGLGGGGKSSLDVVGLLGHGQRIDLLQLHAIFVLDLLLVIGNQGFLLHVAIVESSRSSCAILVGGHVRGQVSCGGR